MQGKRRAPLEPVQIDRIEDQGNPIVLHPWRRQKPIAAEPVHTDVTPDIRVSRRGVVPPEAMVADKHGGCPGKEAHRLDGLEMVVSVDYIRRRRDSL
jgi:hypothetical protein